MAVDLARSLHWIPREPNSYWLVTQAGSLSQPCGMLNFHWLKAQTAFPYVDEAATSVEACERRLVAAYFIGSLKMQGRSGCHGIDWEEERCQGPSSDTFPKGAGSQYL